VPCAPGKHRQVRAHGAHGPRHAGVFHYRRPGTPQTPPYHVCPRRLPSPLVQIAVTSRPFESDTRPCERRKRGLLHPMFYFYIVLYFRASDLSRNYIKSILRCKARACTNTARGERNNFKPGQRWDGTFQRIFIFIFGDNKRRLLTGRTLRGGAMQAMRAHSSWMRL